MTTIDRYRMNWAEIQKRREAIDAHLEDLRDTEKPPVDIETLLSGIVIACAALACAYFYGCQTVAETARAAEERASRTEAKLLECMNGRAVWTYPNESGRGYGKTAVVCRGAEEIPL